MKIINLSPHKVIYFNPYTTPTKRMNIKGRDIMIFDDSKENLNKYIIYNFPKYSGRLPKVIKDYDSVPTREVGNILINKDLQRSKVFYLPKQIPNTLYITSSRTALAVKQSYPERKDIIFPNKLISLLHDNGTYSTLGTLSFGEY